MQRLLGKKAFMVHVGGSLPNTRVPFMVVADSLVEAAAAALEQRYEDAGALGDGMFTPPTKFRVLVAEEVQPGEFETIVVMP